MLIFKLLFKVCDHVHDLSLKLCKPFTDWMFNCEVVYSMLVFTVALSLYLMTFGIQCETQRASSKYICESHVHLLKQL